MTSDSISLGRAFRTAFLVRNRAAASDAANDTDDQIVETPPAQEI